MTAWIGTADTAEELTEDNAISSSNYNFTTPHNLDFWIVLQAEEGSDKGDYDATITFSYYEYDPNCAQYTYWNGEECEPDYDEYCAQYDEQYQELYNPTNDTNINITVAYNGTNCVVYYSRLETYELYETDDSFEAIIIEEILYEKEKVEPIYI